jgi:hypothetical protein
MLVEDNKPRKQPRPARGFSATPPPGFIKYEGRSFILVGADRLARRIRSVRESIARRRMRADRRC